ncbi:hypothetical protein TPHA_0N01460 [Tetrapisispora phaffii CBS 4417]|uniref:C2H2-type domain-containing protein n=1 Tax=Tetrapisispora phaffii (strain ATCC 24235 / CBS 4417 / NBRC 1672 / NRRL Y-8282 / UCD 70-5) TaxID=1071381 RepID=G8C199_TETPH|nr:hypothetical protein TPHA_0N01460 [Tetrapisispora phaffii CBS 4417]CCE65927.1 hypothetical protein TPHA_0N01460 [Tetrapisispora phaffii CBS 4417]
MGWCGLEVTAALIYIKVCAMCGERGIWRGRRTGWHSRLFKTKNVLRNSLLATVRTRTRTHYSFVMFAADYDTVVSDVDTPFSLNLKNSHNNMMSAAKGSTNDSSPDTIDPTLKLASTTATSTNNSLSNINMFDQDKGAEYDVNNDVLLNNLLELDSGYSALRLSADSATRRLSEVITAKPKQYFKRNSFDMDNNVTMSQLMSEFNFNLNSSLSPSSKTRAGSFTLADHNNSNFHIRKSHSKRNNSVSTYLDSNNSNYLNKLNDLLHFENAILSDEEEEDDMLIRSPKSLSTSYYPPATDPSSAQPQFINPSQMLSDKASKAAIVATSGMDILPQDNKDDSLNGSATNNNETQNSNNNYTRYNSNASELETSLDELSLQFDNFPTIMQFTNNAMAVKNDPNTYLNQNIVTPSPSENIMTQQERKPNNRSPSLPNSTPVSRMRKSSTANSSSISANNDPLLKTFKCNNCEKAFRRSEHLKRHIRSVHSSERPFPCNYCEKKFSRSDNLSQHLKTHKKHGDF